MRQHVFNCAIKFRQLHEAAAICINIYLNVQSIPLFVCFFVLAPVPLLLLHHNWTKLDASPPKKCIKNISKYIQDMSMISKTNKKYQADAGRARPGPSPGPRGTSWIYLDISLVYFLGGLGSTFCNVNVPGTHSIHYMRDGISYIGM